jgi:outer membrane protein TolC
MNPVHSLSLANNQRQVAKGRRRRSVQLIVACLSVLVLAVAGRAQSSGADSLLSLEQVVSAVQEQNASVRSLNFMWEAFKERPAQARALPNPMFSYRGMNRVGDGLPWGKEEKSFEIEQEFPWFGKRGLRGQVALKEAEAIGYEYQTMSQDAVLMAKETYFELFSVQRSLAITRAQEALLKQVETIALTKYQVGEVTQQDVLKAQSEISMLSVQLNDLTQQEAALKATLNQLLNRPAQSPLGIAATAPPHDFTLTPKELFEFAQQYRPEVLQARVNIERGQAQRNLMNKEFWPDYRLGLEYRSLRGMDDLVMVQLSFDLPLWRGKYKAGTREATKMVESAKLSLEAAERQTSAEVQAAFYRLQSAQRTFDLYDKSIVTQAEARFDASEAGYRTGSVGFLELLESERFLLDTRVAAAMAEGQLGMALARLERATGLDLMFGSPSNQRP